MGNLALNATKYAKQKNDEFYTRYEDVVEELQHYTKQLEGKKILLPCDSPKSAFVRYFRENLPAGAEVKHSWLHADGQGDFKSPAVKELFAWADVVVTNPPFSLWRDFVNQLEEYKCDYLILGRLSAGIGRRAGELLLSQRLKIGYKKMATTMLFRVPSAQQQEYLSAGKDNFKIIDGEVLAGVPACWYTTLDTYKPAPLTLTAVFDPEIYPQYDNFNAIEVSRVKNIPQDYSGVMGVPITFFDSWNPDQFEILDSVKPLVNGKPKFQRLLIRKL